MYARVESMTFLLALIVACFIVVAVAESGGTIDLNFNVNPGVTRFVEVQRHYGHYETWYWIDYQGYPTRVYVYEQPYGGFRHVYVRDGIVIYIEE